MVVKNSAPYIKGSESETNVNTNTSTLVIEKTTERYEKTAACGIMLLEAVFF